MTKKVLSLFMLVVLAFGILPPTVSAADRETAVEGANTLLVDYDYNKFERSVTATWSKVDAAASYGVWLTNLNTSDQYFYQVGVAQGVSGSANRQFYFDKSYLLDYGMGSKTYRVKVAAYDSAKKVIAEGYSDTFTITDIPMLSKPVVTFTADGTVTWTNVADAETCRVMVVDTETHKGRYVDVAYSLKSYQMSSYMTNGKEYYAVCTAMAAGYRENKSEATAKLIADIRPSLTNLQWSGTTLSWSAFSGADHYIVYLEKYDNESGTYQTLPGYHDTLNTSYDAASKMSANGYGSYRATVLAMKQGGTVLSAPTVSPEIIRSQPTGNSVTGTVKSSLDAAEDVKITLRNMTVLNATTIVTVKGNNATYSAQNILTGRYMVYVSKKNHVTRTYQLIVSGAQTLNPEICPIGDINGDGVCSTIDYGIANSHARKKKLVTDEYKIKCGDVAGNDNEITTADAGRINSHVREKRSLWE